jgi:DNA-binding NarL/FixJ family response regulator
LPQKIIVLSRQSLLADGIASLLRTQQHLFKVEVIDVVKVQDTFKKLSAAIPEIIIVDASDPDLLAEFPISSLLELLPRAKIIQFNCSNDKIQVFTSEQWRMQESGSLISIIQEAVAH